MSLRAFFHTPLQLQLSLSRMVHVRKILNRFSCNISNKRKSAHCFQPTSKYQEGGRENEVQPSFELFWISTLFKCLILIHVASKNNHLIILGENPKQSSPNFEIIKITFPNLLKGWFPYDCGSQIADHRSQ